MFLTQVIMTIWVMVMKRYATLSRSLEPCLNIRCGLVLYPEDPFGGSYPSTGNTLTVFKALLTGGSVHKDGRIAQQQFNGKKFYFSEKDSNIRKINRVHDINFHCSYINWRVFYRKICGYTLCFVYMDILRLIYMNTRCILFMWIHIASYT